MEKLHVKARVQVTQEDIKDEVLWEGEVVGVMEVNGQQTVDVRFQGDQGQGKIRLTNIVDVIGNEDGTYKIITMTTQLQSRVVAFGCGCGPRCGCGPSCGCSSGGGCNCGQH